MLNYGPRFNAHRKALHRGINAGLAEYGVIRQDVALTSRWLRYAF